MTQTGDAIDRELAKVTSASEVDAELAALKKELGAGAPAAEGTGSEGASRDRAHPRRGAVPPPRRGRRHAQRDRRAARGRGRAAKATRAAFATELAALVAAVRSHGTPVADDELVGSDAVVPDPDTTLDEARRLLSEEGLIPD